MGRATAQKPKAVATTRRREAVPPEVYDGFDEEAFNAGVAKYRDIVETQGFDAALSHYAGEATVVVQHGRRTL